MVHIRNSANIGQSQLPLAGGEQVVVSPTGGGDLIYDQRILQQHYFGEPRFVPLVEQRFLVNHWLSDCDLTTRFNSSHARHYSIPK